jgi:hypothetical protein
MLSVGLRRSHAPAAINPTTGSDIAVKLGFFVGKTGYFLSVETTNAGKHFQALMKASESKLQRFNYLISKYIS